MKRQRTKERERRRLWRKNNREKRLIDKRRWNRENLVNVLCMAARGRAKRHHLPFDLSVRDVVIPDFCPVLGIPLTMGQQKWHDGSPSLDRIKPALGYVKGNVRVISFRANMLRSNGTAREFALLAKDAKRYEGSRKLHEEEN